MLIDQEKRFYCQLAEAIQAWLNVEVESYLLYAFMMKGANTHLISATFHHIESFDSKIGLINNCMKLIIDHDSSVMKTWKNVHNRSLKLNKKRNKIVHEPVVITVSGGEKTIELSPSSFNSLVVAKGQTTHSGPIGKTFKPSKAKLREEHKLDVYQLYRLKRSFLNLAHELREFREKLFQNMAKES